MNHGTHISVTAGVLAALLSGMAQARSPKDNSVTAQQTASRQQESRGERVFKQNCARCHDAPQSFPPQITATILRHMRVRASLSARDEQALLDFINPK